MNVEKRKEWLKNEKRMTYTYTKIQKRSFEHPFHIKFSMCTALLSVSYQIELYSAKIKIVSLLPIYMHDGTVNALAFTPDGSHF